MSISLVNHLPIHYYMKYSIFIDSQFISSNLNNQWTLSETYFHLFLIIIY